MNEILVGKEPLLEALADAVTASMRLDVPLGRTDQFFVKTHALFQEARENIKKGLLEDTSWYLMKVPRPSLNTAGVKEECRLLCDAFYLGDNFFFVPALVCLYLESGFALLRNSNVRVESVHFPEYDIEVAKAAAVLHAPHSSGPYSSLNAAVRAARVI